MVIGGCLLDFAYLIDGCFLNVLSEGAGLCGPTVGLVYRPVAPDTCTPHVA